MLLGLGIFLALLGLLIAGLLLFPLRIHGKGNWSNLDQIDFQVHFWKWTLYPPKNEMEESISTPVKTSATHQTSDIFYTDPKETKIKAPTVISKSIDPSPISKQYPPLENENNEPAKPSRLKRLCVQSEMWKAWAKWLLRLCKPSWGLFSFKVYQLKIHYNHPDPIFCAKLQSTWYTLQPFWAVELSAIHISTQWLPKNEMHGHFHFAIEHRLWKWIPLGIVVILAYPWYTTWKAWCKTKDPMFEAKLKPYESKIYQWIKEDNASPNPDSPA